MQASADPNPGPSPLPDKAPRPDFSELFSTYMPFAWRVLGFMGVSSADQHDVCQEVFLVVHRRLADFDWSGSVRSWIFGICVRTASDYRRRKRARPEVPTADLPEVEDEEGPDDRFERRRNAARLDAALDALAEDKRAVFVLYELEELSMSEVAAAIGCPLQTAYSRLYAARKELARAFVRSSLPRSHS